MDASNSGSPSGGPVRWTTFRGGGRFDDENARDTLIHGLYGFGASAANKDALFFLAHNFTRFFLNYRIERAMRNRRTKYLGGRGGGRG